MSNVFAFILLKLSHFQIWIMISLVFISRVVEMIEKKIRIVKFVKLKQYASPFSTL